ncbi:MAG: 1,4-dihydroxy-2-naphthoate polyprenyltransferase [Opitutaceae bacterium]|nr:1,4-dihydroxy-2-naphthoate polyprenyltransferase [Opitutaceae bacterium]
MTEARWQIWLGAVRLQTLPAAVAPVLVGSALAWHDGRFNAGAALLCLGFALLIQIGTNLANDYYDFVKGADSAARIGPRRAVAAGLVTPTAMRRAMLSVFAAAFLLGVSLILWGGPWLLVIGVASIASGIAYTGGPWPLGYHGLGDIFVFIFFGLVAVVTTYYVQAGRVIPEAFIAAVPIGLLAANILLVNNYRDAGTDAAASKRTLVVRFGPGFAQGQFIVSLVIALLMPVLLLGRGYSPAVLLPLLLIPLAWRHVWRLRDGKTPAELILLLGDTGRLLALYALLLGAGLVA